MNLERRKRRWIWRIPVLLVLFILSLAMVTDTEQYRADVSGTCGAHQTGTTCSGHGHAWETPSSCSTCGGDHTISYSCSTSSCSTCSGRGYYYKCSYCGETKNSSTNGTHYCSANGNNYLPYSKTTHYRYKECSNCYSNGTNTRCTNASWSGCGKGSYAAWDTSGICYYDSCTPVYGGHVSNGAYQYDTNNHWTHCAYCGGTMGTTGHSYGAEYTSNGYRYQSCGCGYTRCNGAITYTIAYHGNGATGGSTASSSHTYDVGAYLTGNGYYRTGYTFVGWSASSSASSPSYNNGQAVSNLTQTHGGTVNLYAVWSPNSYKVSFNANGGTNGSLASVTTIYNTSNYYAHGGIVPSRTGYTFLGWYTSVSGGAQVYNASGVCVNGTGYWNNNQWVHAGNITLYAQWYRNVYTVTYNGNGGSVTTGSKTNYYNEAVDLTGVKASKSGYVFTGWNTDPNAKALILSYQMPAGNLTLYAIYSIPVSDVEGVYLVAWPSGNTASARTVAMTRTATQELHYTYTISNANLASITGSSSNAYALVAFDNAGNYRVLKQSAPPPPLEKYVQTVNHYRYDAVLKDWVWFDTTSELKITGETYTPAYLAALPKGYVKDHIDAAYVVTGDKTSSAYYKPITYQVTFDPNGGTVDPVSKEIVYLDVYGELPTPIRTGHTFLGWYTAKEGGSRVISSTKYEIAGNSTLYAHWEINKHNVVYDYWTNGGESVTKETMQISYGANADMSVKATKYGWTFVGWNTDPDATAGLNSIKIGDEDLVLYAIYKKDITATFVDSDNGNTRKTTITIYNRETECKMPVPAVTEIPGWTSLGWSLNTDADALIHASGGSEYTLSDSATFYGCYVQDITITYDTNGSAEEINSQTKERFFNASGNYKNPVFTVASAPKLDKHSFVQWDEVNENGDVVASYSSKQEVETGKDIHLTAKWDKHPEIEAYDRYFTLEEAVNGEITADRLLEKVTATDREDGTLTNGTDVTIPNLNQYDFVNNTDVTITYQAKDSFGNIVEKNITIHVVDTTVTESPMKYYSRFISLDFYTDGEQLIAEESGGLKSTSVWRNTETYNRMLESVLFNSKTNEEYKAIGYFGLDTQVKVAGSGNWNKIEETWVFSKDDLEAVEDYTLEHGLGNLKEQDAVEKFFELFGACKK